MQAHFYWSSMIDRELFALKIKKPKLFFIIIIVEKLLNITGKDSKLTNAVSKQEDITAHCLWCRVVRGGLGRLPWKQFGPDNYYSNCLRTTPPITEVDHKLSWLSGSLLSALSAHCRLRLVGRGSAAPEWACCSHPSLFFTLLVTHRLWNLDAYFPPPHPQNYFNKSFPPKVKPRWQ